MVTALFAVLGSLCGLFAWINGYGEIVATLALFVLGVVQLTEQQRERASSRIREALRRADIGIRKAALHMEMDHADFERALSGERKLDLWRLEMLPDRFWQEYWPLVAEDKGVPQIFHTFLKMLLPAVTAGERRTA